MQKAKRKVKINSLDHTGDSVLAEFDPEVKESVEIAQDKLTAFLNGCVSKFGTTPPVWGKRAGAENYEKIDHRDANQLAQVEDVLVHKEVVGG